MTRPLSVPGYGRLTGPEIIKERLIDIWGDIVHKSGLTVNTQEGADRVVARDGGFDVFTGQGMYRAKRVVLAIGRRGTPRRLEVPGEHMSKVVYRLVDAEQYRGQAVLVVGGGDSALEAAIALAGEPGTEVTLSYRSEAFSRVKKPNRDRLEALQRSGRVRVKLSSQVEAIGERDVRLKCGGATETLRNDAVIVCAGGQLPTPLLQSIGIRFDTKFGTA